MKYVFVVVCWSSLLSQASLPKLRSMCWRMLAEVNKLEGVSLGWAKFGGVCEALGPQFATVWHNPAQIRPTTHQKNDCITKSQN